MLAKPPDPSYGPFVVVTSAIADSVTDWEVSGEPVITISSPMTAAAAIGHWGARDTNGGIRVLTGDLERLRVVPAGAPVDVDPSVRLAPTIHNRRVCRHPTTPARKHVPAPALSP